MVAIKGMELPKSCAECGFVTDDMLGDATCVLLCDEWKDNKNHRAENCPLVEIVTCQECKHYRNSLNHCKQWCMSTTDDFYCGFAERSE